MFSVLKHSILGKAIQNGILQLEVIDIRKYSRDKHKKCDDYPYGGGAGMLMTVQPIFDCITHIDPNHKAKRILLSPVGYQFNDSIARRLVVEQLSNQYEELIFLCGHYEGVDQRVIDICIDECLSIGDYILTGGELAAMVTIDALSRYCDNVLGNELSIQEESFVNHLLEYSQYTRPAVFQNLEVPPVLLSGDHAKIKQWRQDSATKNTKKYRPDLL